MLPKETILSGAEVDDHVSDFRVLKSGAGFYIGTLYFYCGKCAACRREWGDSVVEVPNSRETGYFATEGEARRALGHMNRTGHLPRRRE